MQLKIEFITFEILNVQITMKFFKNLKVYLILAIIILITVLLILNDYLVYALIFGGIGLIGFGLWNLLLRQREEKIAELSEDLAKTHELITTLKSENEELRNRKLNISQLRNIFDLGLMEVNSSFTRTWNENFTRGIKSYHFIGALNVKIIARYGLDLKKLRLKLDRDNREILVGSINPQFLSFNDFDYEWKIAELMEFKQPWLGSYHWRKSEILAGLVSEIKEELRMKTHQEIKQGPEELSWIVEPLRNQIITTLQMLFGSSSYSVKVVDKFDDSFLSLEEFSDNMDNTLGPADISFEEA